MSQCFHRGSYPGSGPDSIPHLEKQGTAVHVVVHGKPMLLIAGELHNSTCGGFASMRPVWRRMAEKNLNSVIATVSWELVEPEEGRFDFSLVDSMIAGARSAELKLVLIWFGSWKNASSVYIPSWVKRDYIRFPRVKDEHGKPLEILVDTVNTVQKMELGDFKIEARLTGRQPAAGGLIIQLGPETFIAAGQSLDVLFFPRDESLQVAVDRVDEGVFRKGEWIPERRLNGDEVHESTWSGTGLKFPGNKAGIQKIVLYRYK